MTQTDFSGNIKIFSSLLKILNIISFVTNSIIEARHVYLVNDLRLCLKTTTAAEVIELFALDYSIVRVAAFKTIKSSFSSSSSLFLPPLLLLLQKPFVV